MIRQTPMVTPPGIYGAQRVDGDGHELAVKHGEA